MHEEDEGDIGVVLALDAVYFHQAKQRTSEAEVADKEFDKWQRCSQTPTTWPLSWTMILVERMNCMISV
jgi:hypothetical protein